MQFKINEVVAFLSEKGKGKILKIISENQLLVEDNFGFEQVYEVKNLVKIFGEMNVNNMNIPLKDNNQKTKNANYSIIQEKSIDKTKKDYWELDLHIEQLTDSHRGLSNFEILSLQMKKFKQFLDKAKANHINKIVVIHGVGEGVLKSEIRLFLHGSPNQYEFFDASYIEYGKGATEVRIRYNF
jgi:dsDNA-specific endonuclease/ATPase MutS2